MTNTPSFVTHNTGNADFTIPETSDLNLIGEYTVTLRSEISVPDDANKSSFSVIFNEYDFVIRVEPCTVDSYIDTLRVTTIEYYLGEPSLTGGSYAFEQVPMCGYDETITVTNLPIFAYHNPSTQDFTID